MSFLASLMERLPGSWQIANGQAFALGKIAAADLPACNHARQHEKRVIPGSAGVADSEVECTYNGQAYGWNYLPRHRFDIRTYGAKVNGNLDGTGTNDRLAVQATIDAAKAAMDAGRIFGAEIWFPAGATLLDYEIGEHITFYSNMHFRAEPGSIIDLTANPSGVVPGRDVFKATGTKGTNHALAVDAAASDQVITLADAPTAALYAAGDMVQIGSQAVYDDYNTNIKIGEINFVRSVDGADLNLEQPLQTGYLVADTAIVRKLTPIHDVSMQGLHFIGLAGTRSATGSGCNAYSVNYGYTIDISHNVFERLNRQACEFINCVGVRYSDNMHREFYWNGHQYGTAFTDCSQDCVASNNVYWQCRHSLSTNNNGGTLSVNDDFGLPRRITFDGNIVLNSVPPYSEPEGGGDAIDSHGAAEDIHIVNNVVMGASGSGINLECRGGAILNNMLIDCGHSTAEGNGIYYHNETDYDGICTIAGNTVIRAGGGGIVAHGRGRNVTTGGATAAAVGHRAVIISNNIVLDSAKNGIQVECVRPDFNQGVVISGNVVDGVGSVNVPLRLDKLHNAILSSNRIKTGLTAGTGVEASNIDGLVIDGNLIELADSSTGIGIFLDGSAGAGTMTNVLVGGNMVISPSAVSSKGLSIHNNATNVKAPDTNDFRQCTTKISVGTGTGHEIASVVTQGVTIAAGVITVSSPTIRAVTIDTEAAAATDDLDTISGGVDGQIITIRSATSSRDTTLKDNTGNLKLAGDFTLLTTSDTIQLVSNGTNWNEISRSTN